MTNLRFHGFGGQGIVTMSEIAALAANLSGLQATSFPVFGPERIGAPVEAYVRLDDKPIRTKSSALSPDWLIIADDKLLKQPDCLNGSRRSSQLLVNSSLSAEELRRWPTLRTWPANRLLVIDAEAIAKAAGHPLTVNAALLGALSAYSGLFAPNNLAKAIEQKLKDKGEAIMTFNRGAAYLGYDEAK
jgi:pyruvate ferredoxin oxidoreductase gamma subunit